MQHGGHITKDLLGPRGVPVGGGGSLLPLEIDFSTLSDGAIPGWTAPTFAVSSGELTNTPTLGSTLFKTDADVFTPGGAPGGAGTYGWVASGGNTIANVAGELEVTYVNSESGASVRLDAIGDLVSTPVSDQWYVYEADAYRSGGNFILYCPVVGSVVWQHTVSGVTAERFQAAFIRPAGNAFITTAQMAAGRKAYLDNQSCKQLTLTELFAPSPVEFAGDLVIRCAVKAPADRTTRSTGVYCCLDSLTNPKNYVYAVVDRYCAQTVRFAKVVNGVTTYLVSVAISYVENAEIEIRRSGNTFQVFYNDAQQGTNQTISDAGIVNNTKHGILMTGGSTTVTNFFLGVP